MTDGDAIVHFTPLWNSAIAESPTFSWRKTTTKTGERSGKEQMYCNENVSAYIVYIYICTIQMWQPARSQILNL